MSQIFYFMYESTSLKEILPSLTRSMEEFKDTVCIFKEKTNTHVWKGRLKLLAVFADIHRHFE